MDAVDADVSKVVFFSTQWNASLSTKPLLQPTASPPTHSPPATALHQCFELERLINSELRELRAAAERAQASTSAWAASLAPLDDALRALGDSESFFGAAAREVEGIAAALSREAEAAEKVKERREQEDKGGEEEPKR